MDLSKNAQVSFSDPLTALIDSYVNYFTTLGSFGGVLFGAAVFLILRSSGLVKDNDIGKIHNPGWVAATGLLAVIAVMASFFAHNMVTSFYLEVFRQEAFSHCTYVFGEADKLFEDCHRTRIRGLSVVALFTLAASSLCLLIWFLLQFWRLRRD